MYQHRWFARCAVIAALAIVALLRWGSPPLAAEKDKEPPSKAKVFVYPQKLTAEDKLSFGPSEEQKETIPIKGESTLVYIDLAPDARFAHATQCVLISTDGAQVYKGDWWLILNGKPLFRGGKEFKVDFPINLPGK